MDSHYSFDTRMPQDCFRYAYGMIEDDFGNMVKLSNSAWDNRWHIIYGHGFYENRCWPIREEMGHI